MTLSCIWFCSYGISRLEAEGMLMGVPGTCGEEWGMIVNGLRDFEGVDENVLELNSDSGYITMQK